MHSNRTEAWARTRDGVTRTAMVEVGADGIVQVDYQILSEFLTELGCSRVPSDA